MTLTEEDLQNMRTKKIVRGISHRNGEREIAKRLVVRIPLGSLCVYVGEDALFGALSGNYKGNPIIKQVGEYLFQKTDVPQEPCLAEAYA